MEEEKIEQNKKYKKFIVLFIVGLVLIIISLALILPAFFECMLQAESNEKALSKAFFIAFYLLPIGVICFGICFLFNLSSLIVSIVSLTKGNSRPRTVVKFSIMTILPILIWFIIYFLSFVL